MIVCHCHAVTDRQVREIALRNGPTCEAVQRACGAGGDCGGCRSQVRMILQGLPGAAPHAAPHAASHEVGAVQAG